MERGLKPYADERLMLTDRSVGRQSFLCWRDPNFFFIPEQTTRHYQLLTPEQDGKFTIGNTNWSCNGVLVRKHSNKGCHTSVDPRKTMTS